MLRWSRSQIQHHWNSTVHGIGLSYPVPWSISTWRWSSHPCFKARIRGWWYPTLGGLWADSTTGWSAGWQGGNLGEVGTECGYTPNVGRYGGGGTAGGGDLRLPPPEHSRTVYRDKAHYGPVSGGGEEDGAKGVQAVVGTRQGGCGGYRYGSLGGGTDGGWGG